MTQHRHLLLFPCHADTNPVKCKSLLRDFSCKLFQPQMVVTVTCEGLSEVLLCSLAQILNCLLTCRCLPPPSPHPFSFFRVIPLCDPTADDRLYHICITAISVSPHTHTLSYAYKIVAQQVATKDEFPGSLSFPGCQIPALCHHCRGLMHTLKALSYSVCATENLPQ